jgi:hypothetical protein
MPETVVGLFRTRVEAESAMRKLEQAGFTSSDIGIVTPRRSREGRWWTRLVISLVAGTAVGAIVGALLTGMVPGMHPMMQGNMLATFLRPPAGWPACFLAWPLQAVAAISISSKRSSRDGSY